MLTLDNNKYDYSALCDSCGFKFKASQLRKRWDGFMVCDDDWEPRNILDFYRTRNDAHLLPFTRPDDSGETTWTPTVTGVTGTYTIAGSYTVDSKNVVTYKIVITPTTGSIVGTNPTFTLPTGTVSVDKKGTALTSVGRMLGTLTNTGTINAPSFSIAASPLVTLTIAGQYTKV